MNDLYKAIIALGRSLDEIDKGRWIQGAVAGITGGRCAVGLISYQLVGQPIYLSHIGARERRWRDIPAAQIAADALRRCVPRESYERTICQTSLISDAGMKRMESAYKRGSDDLSHLETLITCINDTSSEEEVRQWFSDALDLLAEDLLTPLAPEAVDNTLMYA
jgi:hypothetical protein